MEIWSSLLNMDVQLLCGLSYNDILMIKTIHAKHFTKKPFAHIMQKASKRIKN